MPDESRRHHLPGFLHAINPFDNPLQALGHWWNKSKRLALKIDRCRF
jgi:hypothetical protein